MSKKSKKSKAAEAATAVIEQPAEPVAPPVPPPKPPGKKAALIAAKREKAGKKSRRAFSREKVAARLEVGNTPTAWADPSTNQPTTRTFASRLMTAQIAPRFKATIGAPGANTLALK